MKFIFKSQHTWYCLDDEQPDNPDNGDGPENIDDDVTDGTEEENGGPTDKFGNLIVTTVERSDAKGKSWYIFAC